MNELDLVFTPTVNPLIKPRRGGAYFVQALLKGRGGLKREGSLFNIAKRITRSKNTLVGDRVDLCVVLVTVNSISFTCGSLHRELERKVEKIKYMKLEVMRPKTIKTI